MAEDQQDVLQPRWVRVLFWSLIAINVWSVLNGLLALCMAYLLAAGADGVYHGIELRNLASMGALVFVAGNVGSIIGWMGYDEARTAVRGGY